MAVIRMIIKMIGSKTKANAPQSLQNPTDKNSPIKSTLNTVKASSSIPRKKACNHKSDSFDQTKSTHNPANIITLTRTDHPIKNISILTVYRS